MAHVVIVGHFGGSNPAVGGQTIKTRILYSYLLNALEDGQVGIIDTEGWGQAPMKFLWTCVVQGVSAQNVILMTARNGTQILVPLFWIIRGILGTRLHYVVIGGWLPELLDTRWVLRMVLRRVDFIYAETITLANALRERGAGKVVRILPNFTGRRLDTQSRDIARSRSNVCYFSRISERKGVEDAIQVVKQCNCNRDRPIVLDIYGPIEPAFEARFQSLLEDSKEFVRYLGDVPYEAAVQTLSQYLMMLFPTRYYTEGLPGSILDSYAAGTPVLASRWESAGDIIREGETGATYSFGNIAEFRIQLDSLLDDQCRLETMSRACFEASREYSAEVVLPLLVGDLESRRA